MTDKAKTLKPISKGPTGMLLWRLPGGGEIMWPGRGARLQFGFDLTSSAGSATFIDHRSADGAYMTAKEAQAAVDSFIAAKD